MAGYVDAFEEAGLLRSLSGSWITWTRRLPLLRDTGRHQSSLGRLSYDGLRMLDDFAREYRGYVGKVMDHVCMELRSLLYEVLGGE
jgi:hypothetical protein